MTLAIDGACVRQLRNANTFTLPDLGAIVGVSAHVLRRLEDNDLDPLHTLTLAQLDALATTLGVTAQSLMINLNEGSAPTDVTERRDAAQLVGVLIAARKPLRQSSLTHTFGWTLNRLHAARDDAQGILRQLDLHVHDHQHGWQVTPNVASVHINAIQTQTRIDGLDTQHAKLLYRIYCTSNGWRPGGRLNEHVRIGLSTLERAGLITHDDSGYRLVDAVWTAVRNSKRL